MVLITIPTIQELIIAAIGYLPMLSGELLKSLMILRSLSATTFTRAPNELVIGTIVNRPARIQL